MSKKIITFLGKNAQNTTYQYDGKPYVGAVFAEAIYQFEQFDEMLVCVTPEAKASSFPVLEKLEDPRIKAIDIPIGADEEELWTTFHTIVNQVEHGDRLVFDITHGLRSIPFFVFIVAAFLKSAKGVIIDAIYYGAYELKKDKESPAPVINLSEFVSLFDWLNASEQFIRSGNAVSLAKLLKESRPVYKEDPIGHKQAKPLIGIADSLNDVSLPLRLALPDRAMEASAKLQERLTAAAPILQQYARPFTVISDQVQDAYTPIAMRNPREQQAITQSLQKERILIEWYLERNLVLQAVAVAREWLVSWVMALANYTDLYHKQERKSVEKILGEAQDQKRHNSGHFDDHLFEDTDVSLHSINDIHTVIDLYSELGHKRNTLTHAGKRPSNESAETIEADIRKLCASLKALPLPA